MYRMQQRILVIDPQAAFCAAEGSLARAFGGAELSAITACVVALDRFLCEYPRPDEIILIRSEYHLGQFTDGDLEHPFAAACVPGSRDCAWSLSPAALLGKRVVTKRLKSAATVSSLVAELIESAATLEQVSVAGFLTTSCVLETALELRAILPASTRVNLLAELTASRASSYVAAAGSMSRHAAALTSLQRAGVILQ